MPWLAAASLIAGAGASIYGANKQSKDNRAAQDQNTQLQRETNDAAWTSWLMSRGVQPNSPVSVGTVPTAGNFSAVNTRLPLWMTVNQGVSPGGKVSLTPTTTRRRAVGFKNGAVFYA